MNLIVCLIAVATAGQLVPNPPDPPRVYMVAMVEDRPTASCEHAMRLLAAKPLGDQVTYRAYWPSHPRYQQVIEGKVQRLPAVWVLHQETGRSPGAVFYSASGPNIPATPEQLKQQVDRYWRIYDRARQRSQLLPRPLAPRDGETDADRPRRPRLIPDSVDIHPTVQPTLNVAGETLGYLLVIAMIVAVVLIWKIKRR